MTVIGDALWAEAPASGLNALQRHLSALRRALRDLGVPEIADSMVEFGRGAYRLNPDIVTTDFDLLARLDRPATGPDDDGGGPPPRWWLEPLVGLPWEPLVALRASLNAAELTEAHRWLDAPVSPPSAPVLVQALAGLSGRNPGDPRLVSALEAPASPPPRPDRTPSPTPLRSGRRRSRALDRSIIAGRSPIPSRRSSPVTSIGRRPSSGTSATGWGWTWPPGLVGGSSPSIPPMGRPTCCSATSSPVSIAARGSRNG